MAGKTIKIRASEGGEFDCYLATPDDRRQGAGDRARRPPCMASTRTFATSPTSSPRTATSRPRPTCSGARFRDRSRTTTSARKSARSRASRRSRPAKPTWRIRSRTCARCRNSTAAPRRWASATAAPTRSSGRSGSATTPASPATARSMLDFLPELEGVDAAGLHHLGRPGPRGARRGARRLSRRAGAHAERGGARLSRRAARLHDAGEHEGVPSARRARSPWPARWRSSTGCAARRAAQAAPGLVTGP